MIMFVFLVITCFEIWSRGTLTIVLCSGVIVITIKCRSSTSKIYSCKRTVYMYNVQKRSLIHFKILFRSLK